VLLYLAAALSTHSSCWFHRARTIRVFPQNLPTALLLLVLLLPLNGAAAAVAGLSKRLVTTAGQRT
jgi:hypothetical protein